MADFIFKSVEEALSKGLLSGVANGVRFERVDKTENYVTVPPAYVITDSDGAIWTLGNVYVVHDGQYVFNVVRNDVDTEEHATRIEYVQGRIWIYTPTGKKHFSRSRKHFV